MATAELVPPTPVDPDVVLTLSKQEAETLQTVLARVSTLSYYNTYSVYDALADAGVRHNMSARATVEGTLIHVNR